MNGPHDLGGAHGFGPVHPEADEPVFHADWERRAMAMQLAMAATGTWSIDMSRQARERTPPAEYLAASYYEIWLCGLERLLVENGLLTAAELKLGRSMEPPAPLARRPTAESVPALLAGGSPYDRTPPGPAAFAPGDKVRARLMNPTGHTRLPRYLRGRPGRIERVHGAHVYPDSSARGHGEDPRWLYTVAFRAPDVWGPEAAEGDEVLADLFEPYLEPA